VDPKRKTNIDLKSAEARVSNALLFIGVNGTQCAPSAVASALGPSFELC
jgi:hypothetical protein